MLQGSSIMDHFGEKIDQYVQLQESKMLMMIQVEQKILEAKTSFQEAETTFQTKNDFEILKMKADDYKGEDLKIFFRTKKIHPNDI